MPVYLDTKGNVLKDARATTILENVVRYYKNIGYQLPTTEQSEMATRWLGTTALTTGSLVKERITTTGKDGKTYYCTPGNYASGATENTSNEQETRAVARYYTLWSFSEYGEKAVRGKRANALGMYDVNGNVEEMQFTSAGFGNKDHMFRKVGGGGWYKAGRALTVSYFSHTALSIINYHDASFSSGFRLVRTAL